MNRPSVLTLRSFSPESLQAFMLAKLNEADRLTKSIKAEQNAVIECLADAEFARLLIEYRDELLRIADSRQQTLNLGRGGEAV